MFRRSIGGLRRGASLGRRILLPAVPSYMPWRLFWAYFVGFALLAASLSIATKIQVRWSGLLFGTMMFLFVAMLHLPGALASPRTGFAWTIVIREMSFAAEAGFLRESRCGSARARQSVSSPWAAC